MTRQTALRAATLGATLFSLGCGTPPGQFFVVQNQVPNAGCLIPADLSNIYRGQGTMDVRLVHDSASVGYSVFPLLENNLPSPQAGQTTDPNRISLTGFVVEVRLPSDAPAGPITDLINGLASPGAPDSQLVSFSLPWSGSVASGNGHTATSVTAVPGELARRIRATGALGAGSYVYLNARIRARGKTLNGNLTSDPFDYPIRVCDGCLIASVQVCPFVGTPANPGNACNVAQDEPVDCCSSGTSLSCPPQVAAPQ